MASVFNLPLKPSAYAVLLALMEGPKAGFEVMEQVNASFPDAPILGPGTLYRLLRELRQAGWVQRVEAPVPPSTDLDERRTYHALTRLGRRTARAESERLLRAMRAAGVVGRGGG